MRRFTVDEVSRPDQLVQILTQMQSDLAQTESQLADALAKLSQPRLTAADFASISAALQSGGSAPLNVTQLLGILAQSQRGFGVVAATVGTLPPPDLYEVGTFGIVTGPPVKVYYVAEGVPRTWTDTTISSTGPADMMTTDTNQNVSGQKTFSVSQFITATLDGQLQLGVTDNSAGVSANASLVATNDTGVTGQLRSHGSGRTATRYGVTLSKIVELIASTGSLGLLIGSTDNVPIVFGTNSVQIAQFLATGRWNPQKGQRWSAEAASVTPFTASGNAVIIGVTHVGATTVNLPSAPGITDVYIVVDPLGQAGASNITVSGNGSNINGAATAVINTNYGSLRVYYTGSIWNTW